MVRRCHETETRPITFEEIWMVTRTGEHGLKPKIIQIRNNYSYEKDISQGDVARAKKAIGDLKMELPGFLPSGTFSKRDNGSLVDYSGVLCVDLDSLGDRLGGLRESLRMMPFVLAVALSPSGDGLKVFINVINDSTRHEDSFRAIQKEFHSIDVVIDEKCKDLARICFFTYDPDLWVRTEGNEILPPAAPLPPRTIPINIPDLGGRQQIAAQVASEYGSGISWDSAIHGLVQPCPGEKLHDNPNGPRDLQVSLDGAPNFYCFHNSCRTVIEGMNKTLQSRIGKAELEVSRRTIPYRDMRHATILRNPNGEKEVTPEIPLIEIFSPNDLEKYEPPEGISLIGDYHIVKDTGFTFVLGGHPSVGKSFAAISLAVAGARGEGDWFGMTIHRKFKTFIIQTENGLFRLWRNFKELDCAALQDHLRISKPPPYGLLFQRDDFRKQIAQLITDFTPDIVVLDPWNSVARDQEQKTYLDTFSLVRSVLPPDTVLGILAHTRKPQSDERATGRSLMHVLAGSHVMSSVPRTIFIMQHATDDTEDDEIVWTCCKNNDGEPGKRSAWRRKIGLFELVPNFDWASFDAMDKDKRVVITEGMVREVFQDGEMLLTLARDKLQELSGATKSTCYRALSKEGRFADILTFKGRMVNCLPRAG
jgi:hypothetical protein